jgi:hypothetical protein
MENKSQSVGQQLRLRNEESISRNNTPKNNVSSELSKIMLQRLEKITFKEAIDDLIELTYKSNSIPLVQSSV